MTTDTLPKGFQPPASSIGGKTVAITGISKGRGHDPSQYGDHAGLSGYHGDRTRAAAALVKGELADGSFNRVTIDGDTYQ